MCRQTVEAGARSETRAAALGARSVSFMPYMVVSWRILVPEPAFILFSFPRKGRSVPPPGFQRNSPVSARKQRQFLPPSVGKRTSVKQAGRAGQGRVFFHPSRLAVLFAG